MLCRHKHLSSHCCWRLLDTLCVTVLFCMSIKVKALHYCLSQQCLLIQYMEVLFLLLMSFIERFACPHVGMQISQSRDQMRRKVIRTLINVPEMLVCPLTDFFIELAEERKPCRSEVFLFVFRFINPKNWSHICFSQLLWAPLHQRLPITAKDPAFCFPCSQVETLFTSFLQTSPCVPSQLQWPATWFLVNKIWTKYACKEAEGLQTYVWSLQGQLVIYCIRKCNITYIMNTMFSIASLKLSSIQHDVHLVNDSHIYE